MNLQERQAVIDEYMSATEESSIVPSAFIEWLWPKGNHPAHAYFFAKSDEDAAMEYRLSRFRQFANGLRITVKVNYTDPVTSVVTVLPREFPALISAVAGRRSSGGYEPFDPSDPEAMAELQRQGSASMRSWLARYRGAFEAVGFDLSPLEKIGAPQGDAVALSA